MKKLICLFLSILLLFSTVIIYTYADTNSGEEQSTELQSSEDKAEEGPFLQEGPFLIPEEELSQELKNYSSKGNETFQTRGSVNIIENTPPENELGELIIDVLHIRIIIL